VTNSRSSATPARPKAPGVRAGYDPGFLELAAPVPIPTASDLLELPYTHFTVLLRPARRLAAITAVVIDGANRVEIGRADSWMLDDRILAEEQAGPDIYRDNDLDRGHLVRRQDPVWGPSDVAAQANLDTFHYPVCAPQTAVFNQGRQLWAGLEDYILDHATTYRQRLAVFTGCIFTDTDPIYRGLAIPHRFFKIAAWSAGTDLAATGYILDQSPSLDDAIGTRATTEPPPLGPYRTFQVPISDIADLTALPMADLAAADHYTATPVPAAAGVTRAPEAWNLLGDYLDVRL